jgi:hypothetical protein
VQELQQRWYALLYDPAVSRVAVAAMRNLHPELIANVQSRALYSKAEEQLLGTIKSVSVLVRKDAQCHGIDSIMEKVAVLLSKKFPALVSSD